MGRLKRASAETTNIVATAKVLRYDDEQCEGSQLEAIQETVSASSSSDIEGGEILARSHMDEDSEEESPNAVSNTGPHIFMFEHET